MTLKNSPLFRLLLLLGLLYLFFVSISLMSGSFKFFGKGFAEQLLTTTSNPIVGLFIGILTTSIIQSSSTTTSMTVALVASRALTLRTAIPIIMGANIGTSVTAIIVSIAHIGRSDEFERAFAASTVHDFFNLIAVIILFPLQLTTNFLGAGASFMATQFQHIGGLEFANPIKIVTAPVVDLLTTLASQFGGSATGWIMLIVAVVFLFVSLRYIVNNLKFLVIGKVESFFNETLFKNAARAMIVGLLITVLVQSSSITTSLVVPLAGAGILTLSQIFPMTLGANVGTTITAMLASLVTGDLAAVSVAFSHLLFNICGIILIWPMKTVPISMAQFLAKIAIKRKIIPLLYIIILFFLIPLLLITTLR